MSGALIGGKEGETMRSFFNRLAKAILHQTEPAANPIPALAVSQFARPAARRAGVVRLAARRAPARLTPHFARGFALSALPRSVAMPRRAWPFRPQVEQTDPLP